ncbi:MAG: ABC transporter substrate-binding protein [Synergistaceae bacterium]|nr:ABC transporter substrate-binding protein [Synergistaceae bacterium]
MKPKGIFRVSFKKSAATAITAVLTAVMVIASPAPSLAAARTVVDHAGNTVSLPDKIDRVAIASIWPLPSVYCLFEGSAGKLVGIGETSMSAARNSMLAVVMPQIVNVSTGFLRNGNLNIEELLKLKPDIVFINADNPVDNRDTFAKAGIPAVAFSTTHKGSDTIATLESWVSLLGEVLQQEDRASGIVNYGRDVHKEITSAIAKAQGVKRPRALILFEYDDNVIVTAGSDAFGEYWLESTGAVNVAHDLKGYPEINMEQIYKWDPEIIFITNFSPRLAEDLLNNTIEGHDWKNVSAVKKGQVYKFPLGMYRWYPPASDTPLVLKWLATKNQPDLFKDIDIEKEVRDYYKRFYGVDLTKENLYQIFHPSREAAN